MITIDHLFSITDIKNNQHNTHPLCGGLFNAENFDSFGQMKLVVFKVRAEECGLCAGVCEGYANITDD